MLGSFSQESLEQYQEFLEQVDEGGLYDFTRCLRPDGSTYGTDGVCQPPNRVAPKQGLTSGLSTADRSAYANGGGNAAAMKGKSIADVIAQGKKNLARMDQGAGRSMASPQPSSRPRPSAPKQGPTSGLSTADRTAYANGGGNAAVMKGKSIAEVIAQGKKNLARMDQGAGRSTNPAQSPSSSRPSAPKQGPTSGLSTADRTAYANGGGNAAVMKGKSIAEVIAQGKKNLARMDQGAGRSATPTPQPRPSAPSQRPAPGSRLSASDRSAYANGGGNAAAMRDGLSTEDIIKRGKKNLRKMDQGQRG